MVQFERNMEPALGQRCEYANVINKHTMVTSFDVILMSPAKVSSVVFHI
jgi:hypothetical protein